MVHLNIPAFAPGPRSIMKMNEDEIRLTNKPLSLCIFFVTDVLTFIVKDEANDILNTFWSGLPKSRDEFIMFQHWILLNLVVCFVHVFTLTLTTNQTLH